MWSRFPLSLFVILILVSGALGQSDDFTIVALPDTQFYSASYPQIFNQQTQWIRDNATALNIKLVLGEGDIVNGGGEISQWQNADAAMKLLDYVRRNDATRMMSDVKAMVTSHPGPALVASAMLGFLLARSLSRE